MASGGPNEECKEQFDLIKSGLNSFFDFDWKTFTTDLQEQYADICKQLETSNRPEMRCEARRLKSFQAFSDSKLEKFSWWSPSEMASAGLYHTGISNSVQCFCCRVIIQKRPLAYPPMKLHVLDSPNCPFMKGEDVGNISLFEVRVQHLDLIHVSTMGFATEEARHKSFTKWPPYASIQPSQLVSGGFFFSGSRDTVQCFSCGGHLGNWHESDDPWKEHAKWFPECEFLKTMKSNEEIKEYINSYNGFEGFTGKDFIHWTPSTQPYATKLNIFEDENVRLESFKMWPPNANVDPSSLARWGFFYTGRKDAVKCYTCGICIYAFKPGEEAMTEHLKHSPDCTFLKRISENKNASVADSQQLQLVHQSKQDVDTKEFQNTETCFKINSAHWSDQIMALRSCLSDVYNNSTFSNMSPFTESSNISVDLTSLFADISVALKDTRNRPLRQLTLPDILTELADITMIEGEAGSGKTALLKKIAILWALGNCPILNRFSLVFYISVSSTEKQQSLCDIICQQLVGSSAPLTNECLGQIIKPLNDKVLFLLDDYGLVDSASKAIEDLVLKNPWNRMTIAVTVSTNTSHKVRQYAKNILSIQDFPFFSSSYIFKQLFSHDKKILEIFHMRLMQCTTLQAALKTPLFALALCFFWVQNPADNMSEEFSICETFMMHKFVKYSAKRDKLEEVVLSCGQLALEGIFQSCYEFSQESLEQAGVKSDEALQFGLLTKFTTQRLKPMFKFFHPSFQDYLAGRKMNELLQSEDGTENIKGSSYLKKINSFLSVTRRYYFFLKSSCMHSPETAQIIISHIFSLMSNPKAFANEENISLHLKDDFLLAMNELALNINAITPKHFNPLVDEMVFDFAIKIAYESKYMAHCAPIILQFLKDKNINLFGHEGSLLTFLHKYPEGLMLVKSLTFTVPSVLGNVFPDFWNSKEFKSIWTVPAVEEDYSNAFLLTSDIPKPEMKYIKGLNVLDLSKLGFDPNLHKISVLKITAHGHAVENDIVLGNLMILCSLACQIEFDILNCPGFLNFIWPVIDLYKASIKKLSLKTTEFSNEEQELITHMTSLEILQIASPLPEYILSNIHHFKELKELEVNCSSDWDCNRILLDEFISLQSIEKLVFMNVNMETQCDRLATMIEHFPNLISFTIQCTHCPGFEKVVTALCQRTKMETLQIKRQMFNQEIIHLASQLPSLKNLKILEIDDLYSMNVETAEIFAQALASLEKLEEFTIPGGTAARKTVSCFIQQLKHMPNLRKLDMNRRVMTDSSFIELAKICAEGSLQNLQDLGMNNNPDITQSGWRDFFTVLKNVPNLRNLEISRPYSSQFKTEPETLIALIRCVCKLHSLKELVMYGWLLDEKDAELINEMKSKHPNGHHLTLFWQSLLPFQPDIEK